MSDNTEYEAWAENLNKIPFYSFLGIKVVAFAERYARLVITLRKEMNNKYGSLHGGVLSSLADSAVAVALMTVLKPGQRGVTVDLNINYLKPGKGKQIIAEAHIVSKGRTIAVGDVDITDDEGRLLAKSRATYMITS